MKRLLLAFASFALVALLGVSVAGRIGVEAQDTATPETSATPAVGGSSSDDGMKDGVLDTYLAALAENLGISQDELQTAIDATNEEFGLDGMLGGLIRDRHGMRGDDSDNHGFGRGASGDDSDRGAMGGPSRAGLVRVDPAAAAAFLGITEGELKLRMVGGHTFVEVALEQGKTIGEVRAFLIEQATAAIDERLQEVTADDSATSGATEVPASPASTPTATATA